jgi:hypothetical protein
MSNAASNPSERNGESSSKDVDKRKGEAFIRQVNSEEVPSGLRPNLAPPGPDGESGNGGGVGSSL